jgi:two-component system, NtrC family, nitrogen regulation sensor histidine kinase NtrY
MESMSLDTSLIASRILRKTFFSFLSNKYDAIPCFVAIINVIVTYFSVIYCFDFHHTVVYGVLFLNMLVFLVFFYIIIKDIYILRRDSKITNYGSRFRYRLVLLFTIAAVLPALLLGLFSSIAFKNAAEGWFDTKVEKAVNNAENVADAYLNEHNRNIRADIFATEADLQKTFVIEKTFDALWEQIKMQLLLRDLSSITLFNQSGYQAVHAHSQYQPFDINKNVTLSPADITKIYTQEPLITVDKVTYQITAFKILKLNDMNYILNITRPINSKAVQYNDETKQAVNDYNIIKKERHKSELGFGLIYVSFGILIIIFMVKAGQYFALQMTIPLDMLTLTALKIEAGDNTARCPVPLKIRDEIDRLAIAFNQMMDKLSTEKKLTDAVLKGVSTAVVCLDSSYNISLINQRALDIFKISRDHLVTLTDLSPDFDDFTDLLTELKTPKTLQKYNKLYRLTNGDKVNLHIRYRVYDMPIDTIRYIITIDDISELMRAQSAAAWQDIAQRIAHEIKNPLTPIALATEHIERKWGKEIQTNKEAFSETLAIIQKQVSHIKDTANSLAQFAKMPTPIFSRIDMYQIINDTIRLENLRTEGITFSLEQHDSIYISGDERLLSQALINIFKNASEAIHHHAIKNGKIDIFFQMHVSEIIITISDNGHGLPSNINPNDLFNPYVSTKDTGTGIGLAITNKIISDHHGTIYLQNNTDPETQIIKGCDVIIYLPLEILSKTL